MWALVQVFSGLKVVSEVPSVLWGSELKAQLTALREYGPQVR